MIGGKDVPATASPRSPLTCSLARDRGDGARPTYLMQLSLIRRDPRRPGSMVKLQLVAELIVIDRVERQIGVVLRGRVLLDPASHPFQPPEVGKPRHVGRKHLARAPNRESNNV